MKNCKPVASRNHEAQSTNKHITLGILGLFSLASVAQAAITPTGDTSPTPGDGFWAAGGDPVDSYTDIIIGETTASVADAITGSLTVNGASTLETGEAYIGEGVGTYGAVTVSGAGSTWTVNQDPALNTDVLDEDFGEIDSDGAIVVGDEGKGDLTIESSAQVSSLNLYMADSATGNGTLLVDSAATLTVAETIEVGFEGDASMTVQDSAVVNTNSLIVGVESGADGILTVTDSGTLNAEIEQIGVTYADPAKFIVGENGTGTMNVTDGGLVNSGAASIGLNAGSTGTVAVGGAGAAANWNVAGDLDVGKAGAGSLTLATGGTVDVDGATELGADGGTGSLIFSGGTLSTGTLGADVADLTGTGTINTSGLAGLLSKVTFDNNNTYSETLTSGGPTSVVINVTADGDGDLYDVDFDVFGPGSTEDPIPVTVAFGNVGLGDSASSSNTGVVAGSPFAPVTFSVTEDLDVGFEGTGDLTVSNGAGVTADGVSIGAESTGIGTVTVTGLGSSMVVADTLYVGESGEGDLEINTLAVVGANTVHIGKNDSSSGEILVDAATLNVTRGLTLGLSGNGYGGLEISNAGVVSVGGTTQAVNGTIGFGAGDNGVLNTGNLVLNDIDDLEGTGTINTNGINQFNGGITTATFDGGDTYSQNLATSYEDEDNPGPPILGTVAVNLTGNGDGDLTDVNLVVQNGAKVEFDRVDFNRFGSGTSALITGAGSELDVYDVFIGYAGAATMTVDQGGKLDANWYVAVGNEVGGVGDLLVRNGSSVETEAFAIGAFGTGTMEVSGGSVFNAVIGGHVTIGAYLGSGGSGDVTVDGAGSEFNSNGYITVYETGSLTVSNGAEVNQNSVSRAFEVYDGGEVILANGTINAKTLSTDDAGAFSGTGTIHANGIIDLYDTITFDGTNAFSTTLAGGGIDLNVTANGDGQFVVDTLNIINGADVGASRVTVDQLLVEGASSRLDASGRPVTTQVELDVNDGGTIDAGSLSIAGGYGVVEGAGSSVALTYDLHVGGQADGLADFFVEDGASVTARNIYINNAFESGESEVEVIDSGSIMSASQSIYVGQNDGTADLNIRGGATVSAGDDIVIGTDAVVNLTVYGDNQLNAGTDGDGGIQNDGEVNLFAYAGLAASVTYDAVTVGSNTGEIAGSGDYNAFGGTFNVANGKFTVSALVDGNAGLANQDLDGLRATFDSGALVVSFAEGADSSANFSVTEINDVSSIGGFGTLQVYGFTTDIELGTDEQVLLSFFVGGGLDSENFEFWHRETAGSEWTMLDPDVTTYADGWVNFSVTGFSDYALTIPEPQTYALISGALAFAGVMLRRRR